MPGLLEHREEQARREVGVTAVARPVAAALVALFLMTIASGAALQLLAPSGAAGLAKAFGTFTRQAAGAFEVAARQGFFAGNRATHRAIDELETTIEEQSRLREMLQPNVQYLLSSKLGVGNEQVYLGSGERLYFRPGVDYVTGPPFLSPRVLERRALGGDEWTLPPHPDPLPAIRGWAEALAERGIRLLLVPTPVKASIEPDGLAGELTVPPAWQNPSYEAWVAAATEAGAQVFDPAPLLIASLEQGAAFLRADTHWRPEVVERVGEALAREIEGSVDLGPASASYRRQAVTVSNRGDLYDLLGVPPLLALVQPEEVTIRRVVDRARRLWRPDANAEILLLGDSFTNVYSMPELGWGEGAGLAEQLAANLGRPVDKIAVNAGGAYGARERLIGELAAGRDRLAGKKIVVWQFAQRELAVGDWKPLPLDEPVE
jgi:alginate O-acetyltransferase complex protein AlgJ